MSRPDSVSIELLRQVDVFRALPAADLETLALCFRPRRFRTGETVFREGDPGGSLLIVADGTLVALAQRADGREETLSNMGAGEIVGEMAVLDPAPRSATVRAVTESIAYELSHDTLAVLRTRARRAARAIVTAAMRDCTSRLRRLDERIEEEIERIDERVSTDDRGRRGEAP